MRIEHIAIWTDDIERLRAFYIKYFDLECGVNIQTRRKNTHLIFCLSEEKKHALNSCTYPIWEARQVGAI